MILNLCGVVNNEMLTTLVKAVNEVKEGDTLEIFFSTPGGDVGVIEAIINLINSNKEKIKIKFYGEVFSAGMMLFLKVQVPKEVLPETMGMYHFAWQEMTITEGGKPSGEYEKFCYNEMKNSVKKTVEFLKTTKLTEKEIDKVKRQKDVYFSYERMLELNS